MERSSQAITNVPTELWVAILDSCRPDPATWIECREIYKASTSSVVAMSQVCSTWRQIALGTPTLWTHLYFHSEIFWSYPNPKLVLLWLERSKVASLSVNLSISNFEHPILEKDHECIFALLTHMSRWKTGFITIEDKQRRPKLWYNTQSYIGTPTPLLESLHLALRFPNAEDPNRLLPSKIWMAAPNLRELHIEITGDTWSVNATNSGDPSSLRNRWLLRNNIPYSQITHLKLEADVKITTYHDLFTLLSRTPNLISLFLECGIRTLVGPPTGPGTPVILDKLQHLYVKSNGHKCLPRRLDNTFLTPALITLSFFDVNYFTESIYTQLITKSFCTLTELHFIQVRISPDIFLQCMRLSPSLKTIHLSFIATLCDKDVIKEMMEWDNNTQRFALVPNLEVLSLLQDPFPDSIPEDCVSVMDLLEKRLRAPRFGASKGFTTWSIPSEWIKRTGQSVLDLKNDPWNLRIIPNDVEYTSGELWRRFGGM